MAKYVYKGAKLVCAKGTDPAYLDVEDRGIDAVTEDKLPAYKQDRVPFKNIPSFGMCDIGGGELIPCVPGPAEAWEITVPDTSYHLLGADYQKAFDAYMAALEGCVKATLQHFHLVLACSYTVNGNVNYAIYHTREVNKTLNQVYNRLDVISGDYITNEAAVIALVDGFPDPKERKLEGYYELFTMIRKQYGKITDSLAGQLNRKGQAFAELPNQAKIEQKEVETQEAFRTARQLYKELIAIYKKRESQILASNRVTMDSVLYCLKQGAPITPETPYRPSGDYHNIMERQVGIYNQGKFLHPWGVTLKFPQANIEMVADWDEETGMHFLIQEYDIELLVCMLGLCLPEDFPSVRNKYVHKSLEGILEEAGVEIPDQDKDAGFWKLYYDETPPEYGDLAATLGNVIGTVGMTQALAMNAIRAEIKVTNPIPFVFTFGRLAALVYSGIKYRHRTQINTEKYLEMMEPGYRAFMQEVHDIFKDVTVDLKFEYTEKEVGNAVKRDVNHKETRLSFTGFNGKKIQMGTQESGVFSKEVGGVRVGPMITGNMKEVLTGDEPWKYSSEIVGGVYFSTDNITGKVFYLPNMIKITLECKMISNELEKIKAPFEYDPFVDIYLMLLKDEQDDIALHLPQEHKIWARVLPLEMYPAVNSLESLETQLCFALEEVSLTLAQFIAITAAVTSILWLPILIELIAALGPTAAPLIPIVLEWLRQLQSQPAYAAKAQQALEALNFYRFATGS